MSAIRVIKILKARLQPDWARGTYSGYGSVVHTGGNPYRISTIDQADEITSTLDIGYTPYAFLSYSQIQNKIAFSCTLVQCKQSPDKIFLYDTIYGGYGNFWGNYAFTEIPAQAIIELDQLAEQYLSDARYSDEEKRSIQAFTKDAIYILLSQTRIATSTHYFSDKNNNVVEKAEGSLRNNIAREFEIIANHHFKHKHEFRRFFADVALFLALPIGLMVWGARALTGRNAFFSAAKTNRQEVFEQKARAISSL